MLQFSLSEESDAKEVAARFCCVAAASRRDGRTAVSRERKPGTKCEGRPVQGVWGQKSPSGVQGRSPDMGSGGRSPPEAEAILDFYLHNFDLILNYFCFARATSGWLILRNGSCLSMK